jgi:hypothetical protein
MTAKRNNNEVAVELLKCAICWNTDARVLGNVTAVELARFCAAQIITCPVCGSEAWVNIDCKICSIMAKLTSGEDSWIVVKVPS